MSKAQKTEKPVVGTLTTHVLCPACGQIMLSLPGSVEGQYFVSCQRDGCKLHDKVFHAPTVELKAYQP